MAVYILDLQVIIGQLSYNGNHMYLRSSVTMETDHLTKT